MKPEFSCFWWFIPHAFRKNPSNFWPSSHFFVLTIVLSECTELGSNHFICNLVLSTELTMLVNHRKEIRKLTFRALALRRSESSNCGLCVVYIQREELRYWLVPGNVKNNNKLVE